MFLGILEARYLEATVVMAKPSPGIIEVNSQQLEELLDRAASNTLREQDTELMRQIFDSYAQFFQIAGDKNTSIARLRKLLFGSKSGSCNVFHIVGERPGTGHNTLSVYLSSTDANNWAIPNTVDHNITRVVSGIAHTALQPEKAAADVMQIYRGLA